MIKRLMFVILLVVISAGLFAQEATLEEVGSVSKRHMEAFFDNGVRPIKNITFQKKSGDVLLYIVSLDPEGWILVSGNKGAEPVVGYSETGSFEMPSDPSLNAAFEWIESYEDQITDIYALKSVSQNPAWDGDYKKSVLKGTTEETVTVQPFIKAMWNQGSGWNYYCPADVDGSGGHVYVGCVAVAFAQAMSVYHHPDTGMGSKSYYHDTYGLLTVNYDSAYYNWEDMSMTKPDTMNALLLYHAGVAVDMNYGTDGSSAWTYNIPRALRRYFGFTHKAVYNRRSSYEILWSDMLIKELVNGRPIIYRGSNEESGHAFNIDGVRDSKYFHLNWGWGGKNNGNYLIDALKPGTHSYTLNHGAVFGVRPYYYPTDILIDNSIVPEDEKEGSAIGCLTVVDEPSDNEYNIVLICDSVETTKGWTHNYYLDGDTLRTGRTFPAGEIIKDTILFQLTDTHDNWLEVSVILSFETTASNAIGDNMALNDMITLYPNPAGDFIYLRDESDRQVSAIMIWSINGQLVRRIAAPTDGRPVEISSLRPGTYILEAAYEGDLPVRKKFIKN